MRLLFFLLLLSQAAFGASYRSTQDGLFSDVATWGGGGKPDPTATGDTWMIAGHTVVYDVDNSGSGGWGLTTNGGTLVITNLSYMRMNGIHQGSNNARLHITAPDGVSPMPFQPDGTPTCVIEFTNTGSFRYLGTNCFTIRGDTNGFNDWLSLQADNNTTNLFFSNNVVNVRSNDFIVISVPGIAAATATVHQVWGVFTNCIVVQTVPQGSATNTWHGVDRWGPVTPARSNGAAVSKISSSVVMLQKVKIASTSMFTAGTSNVVEGVRFCNLGRSVVDNLNNWTIAYCNSVRCNDGGITHYGTGHTITSCTGFGNSNGGITYQGALHTITSCTGFGNSSGGITHYGAGHTITSCTGYGNASGGITHYGALHTITSCTGYGNTFGGITYQGTGHTITSCTGYGNTFGGIAYQGTGYTITSCTGYGNASGGITHYGALHTITSCTGYGNTSGGIAYQGTGYTITSCTGSNNTASDIAHSVSSSAVFDCTALSTTAIYRCSSTTVSGSGDVVIPLVDAVHRLGLVSQNLTNFSCSTGVANLSTNGYASFWPSNALSYPVGGAAQSAFYVTVAPRSAITPNIQLYLTNGVSYQLGYGVWAALPVLWPTVYTNANIGWTNITDSLMLTNNSLAPTMEQSLWIVCTSWTNPVPSGAGQIGYARVTVPTEYQTRIMK